MGGSEKPSDVVSVDIAQLKLKQLISKTEVPLSFTAALSPSAMVEPGIVLVPVRDNSDDVHILKYTKEANKLIYAEKHVRNPEKRWHTGCDDFSPTTLAAGVSLQGRPS